MNGAAEKLAEAQYKYGTELMKKGKYSSAADQFKELRSNDKYPDNVRMTLSNSDGYILTVKMAG